MDGGIAQWCFGNAGYSVKIIDANGTYEAEQEIHEVSEETADKLKKDGYIPVLDKGKIKAEFTNVCQLEALKVTKRQELKAKFATDDVTDEDLKEALKIIL